MHIFLPSQKIEAIQSPANKIYFTFYEGGKPVHNMHSQFLECGFVDLQKNIPDAF